MVHIDFFYDFISPYSYLATTRLPGFQRQHNVPVVWRPFLLPRLIKQAGNVSPATIPRKALYLLRDLQRWAEYLGVPFHMQKPAFFDARPALCAAQALDGEDRVRFSRAVFHHLWGSGDARPDQPDWVADIVAAEQLPLTWATPVDREKLMTALEQATDGAYRNGAFGAPSFVLHGDGKPRLYWGVDRMDFLGRELTRLKKPAADG